jgi:hypothetical protein
VSESAPISRRRVGRHRQRCSRPTRGGDSIYDEFLTGELFSPSCTTNQYLARYWFAVRDGKNSSPVRNSSESTARPTTRLFQSIPRPACDAGCSMLHARVVFGRSWACVWRGAGGRGDDGGAGWYALRNEEEASTDALCSQDCQE